MATIDMEQLDGVVQWFELLQQPKEEVESIFVKSDYKLKQIGRASCRERV